MTPLRSLAPSRSRVLLRLLAILMLLGLASPALVSARSWRCGARLVVPGQTTADVYDLCGEPAERRADTEYVTARLSYDVTVTRAVVVEKWLYNRGPKQFLRFLTFRDGTLVGIDEGTYGH
jgi:hypothetical protein